MASDPTEYLPVDGSDEPALPTGTALPQEATVLFTFPRTSPTVTPPTYKLTVTQLQNLFLTDTSVLPVVRFVFPSSGSEQPQGKQILLQVTATDLVGIGQVEFLINGTSIGFGVGVDNDYTLPYTVPTDGRTSVNIQAKATNANGRSASTTSFLFIGPAATNPRAPGIINFVDDAAGGSFQVVPVDNVPMADYRWKIGSTGTYSQVPSDGVISVGNVGGIAYIYSVADGSRNASPATATAPFTTAEFSPTLAFVAPVNGASIAGGSNVLLRVSAVDPNGGNIIDVRFYNAGVLIGNATPTGSGNIWQIPYTIPNVAGTLNLTATAISEDDLVTTVGCFVFVTATGPVVTVPNAPTNVTGTAGNGQVIVTWTAPSNTGGASITSYNIYRNGSGSPLASGIQLPYTDSTVTNGQSYTYIVEATNSAGTGAKSSASSPVVPAAPAPPTAINPSYHGESDTHNPNAAAVQSLTPETWSAGARTIAFSCNGTFPTFAEPASYGVRNLILDKNGFNITADMARTSQLFSINGAAVQYNVYTHQNEQYDTNFTISL